MAAITSKAVIGDWGSGGNWVGGVAPAALDTSIIVSGANIHVTDARAVGSKASGIGIGVDVQSGGTLTLDTGGVLSPRGFDTTTNRAVLIEAGGNLVMNGGSILTDAASDGGTVFTVDGNLTDTAASIFDIPPANITWSNSSGNTVLSAISSFPYNFTPGIYALKLSNTGGDYDPGPVANSGGTALGSLGDSSFTVVSGGFDGATSNEVASYAALASNGDFYVDYAKGMVYYKSSSHVLTLTYSYKFATWFSYSLICANNSSQSAISLTHGTQINHAGVNSILQSNENSQGGLMIDNKLPPAIATGNSLVLDGVIFNYCTRPLQYYQSILAGADATHHQVINNVTFNNCRYNGTGGSIYNFSNGLINHGYGSYVDYTNIFFNSIAPIFTGLARGPLQNITMLAYGVATDGTAHCVVDHTLPHNSSGVPDSVFTCGTGAGLIPTLPLTGVGGNFDSCAIAEVGTSGHPTVYSGYMRCVHRVWRVDEWMNVPTLYCDRTYHHGIVGRASDGYINGANVVAGTIIIANSFDSSLPSDGPSGGGVTTGYNRAQWWDNFTWNHCTFDSSNRSFQFNDDEGSVVLVTRSKFINCILSNNQQGIRNDATGANVSSLALTQLDFNDDFGNTTDPTNVLQGTFTFGGANYNSSGSKTCAGCYLVNPNYTLPAAANSLVMVVAGTAGVNKTITVQWGGGTPVSFVDVLHKGQGVLTSASNPDGGPAVLTDLLATFVTSGSGLAGYQVIIVSGTGAGQYGMIKSNTGTALTVIPNQSSGNFAVTPDATSVYIIVPIHQTLTDLAGTGTIFCGINSPELQLGNGTYTDANITITKGYPGTSGANNGVNPNYVGGVNFTPKNTALKGAASDGGDIGALPVQSSTQQVITSGIFNQSTSITSGIYQD